jgi:S-adenosylmethionine synthetase
MKEFLFTSESVTGGHPDKVADQISDAVLDEIIRKDRLVRQTILGIGYTENTRGFDANNCAVVMAVDRQSPDIARGVDRGADEKQGAGDQGMMFGFACNDTKERMPMPIAFAHRICGRLTRARERRVLPWLRPDGKSQVTVRYVDGVPREVTAVVCSAQHAADVKRSTLTEGIIEEIIRKSIPADLFSRKAKFYINPTGRFVVGGPHGDTGLTGRKIIVDTYGGYVAKNIVAAGLAAKCELQLAYAIGVAEPVSVMVDTFGTANVSPEKIERAVRETFDLRPARIIQELDLIRPIYRKTAALGHFGRELPEFTWEKTDKAKALRKAAGL